MIREYLRSAYRTVLPLLYARSNFKLFMKVAFDHVNAPMRRLASATDYFADFVRPIPVHAPFGNSMLVVSPHQDDEAIGPGGALALQVRSGREAGVVMLCDGGDEHAEIGMTRPALVEMRNSESRRAAAVLGIEDPIFLNYQRVADHVDDAARQLGQILDRRHVDAVFTPWLLDSHPEHRVANQVLALALQDIRWNVRVFSYEVWGLLIPNVIVTIDDVMSRKLEMLKCYEYANKAVDYVNGTEGLNMYRSRLLGSGMSKYAECFFEVPSREYIELVERFGDARCETNAGQTAGSLN